MKRLYDLAVLWLLSALARRTVETIYNHGHDDGANALREFMRQELLDVQAACAADRIRAYNNGFRDAMGIYGEVPDEPPPAERVM